MPLILKDYSKAFLIAFIRKNEIWKVGAQRPLTLYLCRISKEIVFNMTSSNINRILISLEKLAV
ncbi:hypothetical protein RO3G_15399 [Rhizopus delemar RA 99-880]|uniref:Uncharacterized protein n=1 Tax=Rhizopus delemar (strain RA 99-880 / ATCC MYA-4621 / FGSC 9543 / NRRL 43880) TaxID=246409 RepID=I1CQF8_RHIO9|nr:hypothetical protein RO3G_15399 [Rhizopus delemar RA 99-880]|eukprot:EIE90688.1 hypothetical protein RO3G_15399 [Rhizopus delemar RA 99-880]